MTDKWELGQTGEELAADYLRKQGYQILHHNWNLHRGCELDLVAQKDGELHFIEVKTRRRVSETFGTPEEAINARKMQHIQAAISYYVQYNHIDPETPIHMDAVSVVYRSENDYDLKYLQDIHFFSFSRTQYKGRRQGWRFYLLMFVLVSMFSTNLNSQNIVKRVGKILKKAGEIDSSYVEPKQHAFKGQLDYSQSKEYFFMESSGGQRYKFASGIQHKLIPAVGIEFLTGSIGISLNADKIDKATGESMSSSRMEYSINAYSPMFNVDLYYRKTGNDFNVKRCIIPEAPLLADAFNMGMINDYGFVSSERISANLFYIFNHKKFSYPAAMTSSVVQRRSAGSPIVGFGYSKSEVENVFNDLLTLLSFNIYADGYIDPTYWFLAFDPTTSTYSTTSDTEIIPFGAATHITGYR